jgi:hypothetical protein
MQCPLPILIPMHDKNRGQTERFPIFDEWKLVNVPSVPGFPDPTPRFTISFAGELSLVSLSQLKGALHPSVPGFPDQPKATNG